MIETHTHICMYMPTHTHTHTRTLNLLTEPSLSFSVPMIDTVHREKKPYTPLIRVSNQKY